MAERPVVEHTDDTAPEAGPTAASRLDELIPRWLFPVRHPGLRLLVALGIAAASLLPMLAAAGPDEPQLTPVLVIGLVVVAALAGSWPVAIAGLIVTVGYWWYGIPPANSFQLTHVAGWVSLVGMAAVATMLPVLTWTMERALGDVRQLDEARRAAGRREQQARHDAENAARRAEALAHQYDTVVGLARAVAGANSLVEVAERALQHLVVPAPPTDASIAIVDGDQLRILSARGASAAVIARLETVSVARHPWLHESIAGAPSFVDDREAFAATHPDAGVLRLYPSGSWALIPFRHDTTIGLLSVHHQQPQTLSHYAAHFTVVADVIATALERARARESLAARLRDVEGAFAERDRIARTLSGTLIPQRLPVIPGFTTAGWVQPATDGVAGDFYDLVAVDDGWVAMLGDVSGKGAEAAAVTSLARYAGRAAALTDPDPATIAELANRALYEDSSELFCTIAIVHCSPASGNLEVTLAGHPHVRLVLDGRVDRLGQVDIPLGIDPRSYQARRYRFDPGASLILFSDGLTDRSHSFTDDDLDEFLTTAPASSAGALLDSITALVASLPSDHPDDVAVLVVHRGE